MTEKEARKYAKALKKKLIGKGWRIRVWKNCGNWYYRLLNGGMQLHEEGAYHDNSYRPLYWTLFSEDGHGGNIEWSMDNREFSDPNKAVADQLKLAKKDTQKRVACIEKIEKNLQGS